MHLRQQIFLYTIVAALLLVCSPASADITNGSGNAHGTASGTITSVTYGDNGRLESAEFTDTNGTTYEITNGDIDNDISDFGTQLEKAHDNGDDVTIESDFGDMKKLTRKKKPKPAPDPQPVPDQR